MEEYYLFSFLKKPSDSLRAPGRATAHMIPFETEKDWGTFVGPIALHVAIEAKLVTAGPVVPDIWVPLNSFEVKLPAGAEWPYRYPMYTPFGAEHGAGRVVVRPASGAAAPAVHTGGDIPCGFAVANIPDTGKFFPSPCEGCPPGVPVAMPPGCSTALNAPLAKGGFVRPRFFNGMHVTRDDFETLLRFERLKRQTTNKALGSGVAWGLGVETVGSAVRVRAGYGRDCCGHDLVVTCPYDVPASVLLADPLACTHIANNQGNARMHLLLEYVECPEEPRPVHGDACATAVLACEMSRVRETVRLRLVPPRDYKPNGPIDDFLDAVKKHLTGTEKPGLTFAHLMGGATTAGAKVPFRATVKASTNTGANTANSPNPLVLVTLPVSGAQPVEGDTNAPITESPAGQSFGQLVVSLGAIAPYHFTAPVRVLLTKHKTNYTPVIIVNPPTPISGVTQTGSEVKWSTDLPRYYEWNIPKGGPIENLPGELGFRVEWTAEDGAGAKLSGTTNLEFNLSYHKTWERTPWGESHPQFEGNWPLHARVYPTAVTATGGARPNIPCLIEACDPFKSTPRFPALPPFDHPNPTPSIIPADPRVLVMAAYHAFALMTDNDQPLNPYLSAIYALLLKALFRVDATPEMIAVVHRLFRDWCDQLLYRGPDCDQNPDGVVIGCARVEAGQICSVDSWGGRRWAVHYPLVAHWLGQFGFTPPDVLASRVFDMICCLADQPPVVLTRENPMVMALGTVATAKVSMVPIGEASALAVGDEKDVAAALAAGGTPRAARTAVELPEFIALVWRSRSAPAVDGERQYRHVVTDALPMIHLIVFVPMKAGAAVPARPGLVTETVRPAVVAAGASPLLRGFAARLALELLEDTPLPDPGGPVTKALADVGIATVGELLARDPERVMDAIPGQPPERFVGLWQKAEEKAVATATAVAKSLPAGAHTRAQLRADTGRAALVKNVREGPGKGLDAVKIDRAVDTALRAESEGGR